MGLPLVISAARLNECRGNACLSGVVYDISNGYTARWRELGSNALQHLVNNS